MRFIAMFVSTVCVLFLIRIRVLGDRWHTTMHFFWSSPCGGGVEVWRYLRT